MNNTFIHLIQIPMTGVGIRPYMGDDWFRYRIEIFKKYTLNSLLNQSNRKFILWLTFRDEERYNPLTLELEQYLRQQNIVAFMTFNGLPYWDDKFSTGLKERCLNFARVLRMAYREKNILGFGWRKVLSQLFEDKNANLKERLAYMLTHLKNNLAIDKFNWVYVTRIDSDDMFHQDFIREIQEFQPFPGAITCRDGYVYNSNTGQLAEWNPKTSPPFHTIVFPSEIFFDPARHVQYFRGFKSHEDVPTVFNSQNIKGRKYCVLIHKQHISTVWDHPWKGPEVTEGKEDILNDFGIGDNRYFKMDGHKVSRVIKGDDNLAIKEIIDDYLAHKSQGRDYEPETTKIVKDIIKPGDICVDVGASIGYMTLELARATGEKGHVYAFEPTNNQFPYLERNMELNGYKNRVTAYNLAAWDKQEKNFVRRDEGKPGQNRIQTNAGFTKPIEGVVLDDVLPEKVDFIKMDVDGSEPRALKGLLKTFERNKNLKMIIEYYPACITGCGNDPNEMMAILDKYFTYEKIEGDYNDEYWNYLCKRKNA